MALQQDFRSAFNGFNREDVVHYIEQVNAKHNAEISRLNSDIQYLQEQLSMEGNYSDLTGNGEVDQQLQEQAERIADLEAQLAAATAEHTPDEQAERIAELEAQLAAVPTEDVAVAELEAENAKLTQKVAELERKLLEAQGSLKQSKEDNESLQALLDTALSRQSHVQSQQEAELSAYRRAERVERQAKERANYINEQVNGSLADATTKVDEAAAQVAAMAEEVLAQIQKLQAAVGDSKVVLKDAAAHLYTINPYED